MAALRASTDNETAAGDELAAVFSDFARRYAGLGWALVRLTARCRKARAGSRRSPTATPSTPPASGTSGAALERRRRTRPERPGRRRVRHRGGRAEAARALRRATAADPDRSHRPRPLALLLRGTRRRTEGRTRRNPAARRPASVCGAAERAPRHRSPLPLACRTQPWNTPLREVPEAVLDYLKTRPNGDSPAPLPETIPIGEIDRTLASLAGSMRRRNADEEAICAALLATLPRCEPGHTHTEADCRRIARSVARYEPSQTTSSHLVPARPQVDLVPRPFPVREGRGRTTSSQLVSGWRPIDLVARGVVAPQPPDIIELFYCGRRHLLAGESEAAKTWLELVAAAAELREGARRRLGGRRPRRRR